MDLLHLDKLIEEQKKVLEQNEYARNHSQNLRDDYCKLKDKLNTIADQTSHNYMVPIGSVGFFPGKLLHTNEILVLLGDNWFVERSTKQAQEIVNRRITLIDDQLSDLKKEYDNIKSQNEFTGYFKETKETEDIKEIREEIPEGIKEIREEISEDISSSSGKIRKAHTPKHNLFPRRVDIKKVKSKDATLSHDELFARLNELEHEELIADELEQINAMNLLSESNENNEERHVKFKNNPVCANEPVFTSPADIYDKHMHQDFDDKPLKSILKKDSRSNSNENLRLKPILKSSPEHNSLLDDDYRMLKTPPDSQLNEMLAGTPEFTDDPRSILKLHESCHNRSKQCLETVQDDFDAKVMNLETMDEKRSILKNTKEYIRPVTPEDDHKGILKSEPKRVKNPESTLIGNEVDHFVDSNFKSMNNQMPFSGTVLERNILNTQSVKTQEHLGTTKPVSKFKASRLKK